MKSEESTTADKCIHKRRGVCSIFSGDNPCVYPQSKCSFYQTKLDAEESIAHYNRLMNAKTPEEQRYYADKYHGGKMPWKKGVYTS